MNILIPHGVLDSLHRFQVFTHNNVNIMKYESLSLRIFRSCDAMKGKIMLLALLLVPWLSILKIDKITFKRYLPVLTFSSLVIALLSELSSSYTWWKIRKPLFPKLSSSIPFIFGPFFIANL